MTVFSTPDNPKGWAPDVVGLAPRDVIPEALIVQTSSFAGFVEGDAPSVRVPFVSFDADAAFTPEGTQITEADPDSSEVVIHTGKVAVLARVSREQYQTGDAASLLSDSMRIALIRKANGAYLAQAAPVGPATTPPAGLLNLGVTDGGSVAVDLDAVIEAVADIEGAGGTATHIIASPTAWATLSQFKTATGSNVSLVGAGTEAVTRSLLGVPVLVTNAMSSSGMVVLDKNAVLSAYGNVDLATSTDYYFGSDGVALRATFRFGQAIVDPDRVVKLTVAAEGS